MLWGLNEDLVEIENSKGIMLDDLRRVFDFVITLDKPILRDINL